MLVYVVLLLSLCQAEIIQVSLPEEVPVGTTVTTLYLTGQYSMYDRNEAYFRITFDGIVKTKSRIDREEAPFNDPDNPYEVKILHGSNLIQLIVSVIDVNDNRPIFKINQETISISEGTNVGFEKFLPVAIDIDYGINSTQGYRIESGNIDNTFEIVMFNPANRKFFYLRVKRSLDRETTAEFNLKIVAYDGAYPPRKDTLYVKVIIEDENDTPPEFNQTQYFASVKENARIGAKILSVKATGSNARIVYSFDRQFSSSLFMINKYTGAITLQGRLDYENNKNMFLIVLATDEAEKPRSARVYVNIKLIDVNDNEPEIEIMYNSATDTVVVNITSSNQYADVNETVKITCSYTDTKSITPTITWYKNNVLILTGITTSTGESILTFENSRYADNGEYTCNADYGSNGTYNAKSLKQYIRGVDTGVQETQYVVIGDAITQTCVVHGDILADDVVWTNTEGDLFNGSRFTQATKSYDTSSYSTTSTLVISAVTADDSSSFVCTAEYLVVLYKANTSIYGNIDLEILDKIPTVYITESRTEYAKASFNIVIGCHVPDDPQATFSYWERNGKEIVSDSRRYYESSRKKLNIIGIRVSDTGRYTCVGLLSNGIVVQNTTTLTVKPAITVTCTENQFLDIGATAVIECSVDGDTQPTKFMVWMKRTQTIQSDGSKYILSADKSRLEIRDLRIQDGGTYSVLVKTSLGTLHQASSVTVIVMSIIESPKSVTVSTGSAVSFTCIASGTPLPFVFWNKDDKKIDADDNQIRIETKRRGYDQQQSVLMIKRATKFNGGSYVCFAYNVKINVTSQTAVLTVIDNAELSNAQQSSTACDRYVKCYTASLAIDGYSNTWSRTKYTTGTHWLSASMSLLTVHQVVISAGTIHGDIRVSLYKGGTLTGHCDTYTRNNTKTLTLDCTKVQADMVLVKLGVTSTSGTQLWVYDLKVRGHAVTIGCYFPNHITNGRYIRTLNTTTVQYQCNTRYVFTENGTDGLGTCEKGVVRLPTCVDDLCAGISYPRFINNGKRRYSSYSTSSYTDNAYYCYSGYMLSENSTTVWHSNRLWGIATCNYGIITIPICVRNRCPNSIPNGSMQYNGGYYNCSEGYQLEDLSVFKCGEGENPVVPKCVPIICYYPKYINNAMLIEVNNSSYNSYTYHNTTDYTTDNVRYNCSLGYIMADNVTHTDGTVMAPCINGTRVIPVCVTDECYQAEYPLNITNGYLNTSTAYRYYKGYRGYQYGYRGSKYGYYHQYGYRSYSNSTVQYVCNKGYKLHQNSSDGLAPCVNKTIIYPTCVDEMDVKLVRKQHGHEVKISFDNKTWGSVCDDSWGDDDANVVCRSFGWKGGLPLTLRNGGIITATSFNCTGMEKSLGQCGYAKYPSKYAIPCKQTEVAGVKCYHEAWSFNSLIKHAKVRTEKLMYVITISFKIIFKKFDVNFEMNDYLVPKIYDSNKTQQYSAQIKYNNKSGMYKAKLAVNSFDEQPCFIIVVTLPLFEQTSETEFCLDATKDNTAVRIY